MMAYPPAIALVATYRIRKGSPASAPPPAALQWAVAAAFSSAIVDMLETFVFMYVVGRPTTFPSHLAVVGSTCAVTKYGLLVGSIGYALAGKPPPPPPPPPSAAVAKRE